MSGGQHQEFCVRWNSHLGSIGAAFPHLLAGQRFVDVTLACEGHQVHCHRLVLAACSSYFDAILAENPCKHPVIILPSEIKLWEIQALVDFMYKGEVNVTQAGLPQLLRCAEQLRIRGLHGSDAALNVNQIKALKALAAVGNDNNTTETESTNDTTTTASRNTPTTTCTSLPINKQQPQQQQLLTEQFIKKEQPTFPIKQQQQQQTRQSNGQTFNQLDAQTSRSNFSSAEDDDDEDNSLVAADSPMIAYSQTEEYAGHDTNAIDDDHSYVVSNHDDESYNEHDSSGHNSTLQTSMVDGSSASFKRVRRSEASLAQAAKCVSKGETFQTVSNMFNIPVSTIRFYMARKGILPKRKRGRGAASNTIVSTLSAGTLAELKQQQQIQQQQQQHLQQQQQQQQIDDDDQFHIMANTNYKIEEQQVSII